MTIETFQSYNFPFELRREIVAFLHANLDPHETDAEAISKALNYIPDRGGHLLLGYGKQKEIIAACVINHTHMDQYNPENFLVYLAVEKEQRRQGYAKMMMDEAVKVTHGDIYLHIEAGNPARVLYEKYGFTTPYIEMRYKK